MGREAMLQRVRSALGRTEGQPPPPVPAVRMSTRALDAEGRVQMFCELLEKLAGTPHIAASPAAAREYVAGLIQGKRALASNSRVLAEYGITSLPGVVSGVTDKEELRQLCADVDIGITSADFALADTGTMVMLSGVEDARMISLLPLIHIAVIPRERMLSGLDELLELLPRPAEQTSSMVLITGTSRTADIEQILVRGVHGPGVVHAIIV